MKEFFYVCSLGLVVTVVTTVCAYAYDQAAVVDTKSKNSIKAQGAMIGAFILKPSIEMLQTYDDNIYRTGEERSKDWVTSITPAINISSNWNLHQIEVGMSGDINRYAQYRAENHENFAFYVSGRYDIDYETYFTSALRHQILHEDRSSLDDVNGDSPVQYDVNTASLGFVRALGILKLYFDSTLRSYHYEDSEQNNIAIDNSERDRHQVSLKTRLAYSVSDNAQAFVQTTFDKKKYDNNSVSYRDSFAFEHRAGISANLTGKLEGEIFLGYLTSHYDGAFDDINAPSFGGSMLWNLSGLTSIRVMAERSIIETSLSDSSGVVRTSLDLDLQHSLTPDILLEANFKLDDDIYKGGASNVSRDNRTYNPRFGVAYNFGKGYTAHLAYNYSKRDFRSGNNGYENSKIMASVIYVY